MVKANRNSNVASPSKKKKTRRKEVAKSVRFEVFKRDRFTCQYCGRQSPDVVLVVDHIQPLAKGGDNNIVNLVTSCFDCNSGKSDRVLSDDCMLAKQRDQLSLLQERREQTEMLAEWRQGLLDAKESTIDQIAQYWLRQVPGAEFTDWHRKVAKRLEAEFDFDEIVEAIDICVRQYVDVFEGVATAYSERKAFEYVGGVCKVRREERAYPPLKNLRYVAFMIVGIRFGLEPYQSRYALDILEGAHRVGAPMWALQRFAMEAHSWESWESAMIGVIEKYQAFNAELEVAS